MKIEETESAMERVTKKLKLVYDTMDTDAYEELLQEQTSSRIRGGGKC